MPKVFYRRNLPHLQRDKPHFVTFCTYRRAILPDWARSIVLDVCMRAHGWTIFLHTVVVMPDHVHLVFTPQVDQKTREVFSLARIMKVIKGASAHLINQRLGTHENVWQEESFDRVLRSSENLDAKIKYILENPVRKRLVQRPQDYPWLWVAAQETAELRSAGQVRTPAPT